MRARLRRFAVRLRSLLEGSEFDGEFDQEIQSHLDLLAEKYVRDGMEPEQARWAARRQFGNLTSLRENRRRLETFGFFTAAGRDLRYAARQLRRNPAFTVVAVASLALAIGMNTAIFSVVNAALLKPLPVQRPGDLVLLTNPDSSLLLDGMQTGDRNLLSYPEYVELRTKTTTLSGLCASGLILEHWTARISNGVRESIRGRLVSENYFSVFGVEPALGRFFTERDAAGPGTDPFAVISYDYWRRRFNGSRAVLGTRIRFDHTDFTILGVAAKGFRGETVGQDPDLWVSLMMEPLVVPGMDGLHEDLSRSQNKLMWLHGIGRRKAGITIAQVQAEMNVLFSGILEAGYPSTMPAASRREALNQHIVVTPVGTGAFHGRAAFSLEWTILSALAGLVLLIACANVANLLLARSAARSHEVAIRLSIGAAKFRLVRQFLTESLLLASLGGLAGMCIATVGSHELPRLISGVNDSFILPAGLDLRVFVFSACLTFATALLFGLAPSFRALGSSLNGTLKDTRENETGSPRAILTKAIVVAQVSLSLFLVLGAGLFLQTLRNLQSVDLGYPRNDLLLVHVDGSSAGYSGEKRHHLQRDLAERIRRVPGVRAVTWSDRGLFSGFDGAFAVNVEGFTPRNADEVGSTGDFIGPGYFSTVEIPLLLGREIGLRDEAGSPRVCVINEAFAKRFLAGRNPIGRHVSSPGINDNRSMEIVGVSTNARVNSLRGKIEPKIYAASEQLAPAPSATFEVRTSVDPGRLSAPIRAAILSANADLEITSIESLRRVIDERNTPSRLIASLCCLFGAVALLLAATGVYGVLSYRVSRRSREIGVRLALGASRGTIIAMILKETGFMIAAGIALGVTAAAVCTQILSTQLYGLQVQGPRWSVARYEHVDSATQLFGVKAMDPITIGTAVVILGVAGMIAATLPALRAARTDPMRVLRHE